MNDQVLLVWNDYESIATFYFIHDAPEWLPKCHNLLINGNMPDDLSEKLCAYFYGTENKPLEEFKLGERFNPQDLPKHFVVVNTGCIP